MKYELENHIVQNILTFLDRVQFNGLKEVQATIEIINALNNPINENKPIPVEPK